MIWFILGGAYSITLVALGFWLSSRLSHRNHDETAESPLSETTTTPQASLTQHMPSSEAIKAMSPSERLKEENKDMIDRVNHLLS